MYVRTYIRLVVEWDRDKSAANLRKHRVDFADAVGVLSDALALMPIDEVPNEQRFVTVGMNDLGRILVLVYTWRGGDIRLISARKATRPSDGSTTGKR